MEIADSPKIVIRAQTAEEEFRYLVDHILNQLAFYEKHGYKTSLPEADEFRHPIEPTLREKAFTDFLDKEYKESFYVKGVEVLKQNEGMIKSSFPIFIKLQQAWGLKVFPEYTVKLTKYGPGGSYDSSHANITMLTTADGTFKRLDPIDTVIHECVHIGIEEPIVKKFKLTHTEKERLVDLICKLLFKAVLPKYKTQGLGDTKIDPFVASEADIYDLPAHIGNFIEKNPRYTT